MKKYISISNQFDFSFLGAKDTAYRIVLDLIDLVPPVQGRRSSKSEKIHTLVVTPQHISYLDQLILAINKKKASSLNKKEQNIISDLSLTPNFGPVNCQL